MSSFSKFSTSPEPRNFPHFPSDEEINSCIDLDAIEKEYLQKKEQESRSTENDHSTSISTTLNQTMANIDAFQWQINQSEKRVLEIEEVMPVINEQSLTLTQQMANIVVPQWQQYETENQTLSKFDEVIPVSNLGDYQS
jgi:hypothetical protein